MSSDDFSSILTSIDQWFIENGETCSPRSNELSFKGFLLVSLAKQRDDKNLDFDEMIINNLIRYSIKTNSYDLQIQLIQTLAENYIDRNKNADFLIKNQLFDWIYSRFKDSVTKYPQLKSALFHLVFNLIIYTNDLAWLPHDFFFELFPSSLTDEFRFPIDIFISEVLPKVFIQKNLADAKLPNNQFLILCYEIGIEDQKFLNSMIKYFPRYFNFSDRETQIPSELFSALLNYFNENPNNEFYLNFLKIFDIGVSNEDLMLLFISMFENIFNFAKENEIFNNNSIPILISIKQKLPRDVPECAFIKTADIGIQTLQ